MPTPLYSCKPTGQNVYIGKSKPVMNRHLYLSMGWKYSEYRKSQISPRRSVFHCNAIHWIYDKRASNRFINKTGIFS